MARTIRTKVYKFNELSESAKNKVIEKFYDINVGHDWWSDVYYDAAQIGLKIKGFDIDRGNYCKGEFLISGCEVAEKIKLNHGEKCETYKTALDFLSDWQKLVEKHSDGISKDKVSEDNEYEFDQEADELEKDFLKSLCEDYRIILSNEYEYLTSEEAIIETIKANEYEFTSDGRQF